MNRSVLGGAQMATSQVGGNLLGSRPGLPSPTRGISPKDMFNVKQVGNRNLNATITRCGMCVDYWYYGSSLLFRVNAQ